MPLSRNQFLEATLALAAASLWPACEDDEGAGVGDPGASNGSTTGSGGGQGGTAGEGGQAAAGVGAGAAGGGGPGGAGGQGPGGGGPGPGGAAGQGPGGGGPGPGGGGPGPGGGGPGPGGGGPGPGGGGPGPGGGGQGPGGAGGAPLGQCETNGTDVVISSNHGHVLVVSAQDVIAGQTKIYDIEGTASHPHSVTLTSIHFAALQNDQAVMVTSSFDGHDHDITVTCA